MIVRDGKCYAENPVPVMKITGFEAFAPHLMKVVFNDGETRIFDGRTLLRGEAFAPLADANTFADCKLDYETLTWLDDGALRGHPRGVHEDPAKTAELQALLNLKQSEKGMKEYKWPKSQPVAKGGK